MQLLRSDAALEHDLLHRAVRHLHPVDLAVPPLETLEARVELGEARRAGPAVEVGEPEPVLVPLEIVQQQGELALVEDRLPADAASPALRADGDAHAPRELSQLARLVGEHPVGAFLLDEEARMVRPAARPEPDRCPAERSPDRRSRAPDLRADAGH